MSEATTQDTTTVTAEPKDLLPSITQREWLTICRALEAPKDDVLVQTELLFPALCWINRKRTHGGADWDSVLDLTDAELYAELGIGTDDNDEAEPEGKENEAATSPAAETPPTSTLCGGSIEPDSVSPPASPQPSTTS